MTIRQRIAALLRKWADRLDPSTPDVQPSALGGTGPWRPGD